MNTAFKLLTDIIKNVIFGSKTAPDKNSVIENLSEIYKLAAAQDLAHIVGYYIEKNGFPLDSEPAKTLVKYKYSAIFRDERQAYECARAENVLQKENIRYIKLKGTVLKEYYPQTWLRTRCDTDILIEKENLQNAADILCKQLNWTVTRRDVHDFSMYSKSGVHTELHYHLMDRKNAEKSHEIFEQIWERFSIKSGNGCEYKMTDDAFYLYHIAHMAKHIKNGGGGVRPFIDQLILENANLNDRRLLERCGMTVFENHVSNLSESWFSNSENSGLDILETYILGSTMYGTQEDKLAAWHAHQGSKLRVFLNRLFLSSEGLCVKYPSCKKHPYLMPLYQVRRWIDCVKNGDVKTRIDEAASIGSIPPEKSKLAKQLFDTLKI